LKSDSSQENVLQNIHWENVFSGASGITGKCAPNFLMLPYAKTFLSRASACPVHKRDIRRMPYKTTSHLLVIMKTFLHARIEFEDEVCNRKRKFSCRQTDS
jgi:hypothetical protein